MAELKLDLVQFQNLDWIRVKQILQLCSTYRFIKPNHWFECFGNNCMKNFTVAFLLKNMERRVRTSKSCKERSSFSVTMNLDSLSLNLYCNNFRDVFSLHWISVKKWYSCVILIRVVSRAFSNLCHTVIFSCKQFRPWILFVHVVDFKLRVFSAYWTIFPTKLFRKVYRLLF